METDATVQPEALAGPDTGAQPMNDTPQRPDHVPEKFWDEDSGAVRTEALAKSYSELEKRLGSQDTRIPDTPDDYELNIGNSSLAPDPAVNARLHAAGFSHDQAKLAYELADEYLTPLAQQMTQKMEHEAHAAKLSAHFGGERQWGEVSRQLRTWGTANLPGEAFKALSLSSEGVIAMHRMMNSGEPTMVRNHDSAGVAMGENELRAMMQNPRYWRDQDPTYVTRVRRGFEALYPS